MPQRNISSSGLAMCPVIKSPMSRPLVVVIIAPTHDASSSYSAHGCALYSHRPYPLDASATVVRNSLYNNITVGPSTSETCPQSRLFTTCRQNSLSERYRHSAHTTLFCHEIPTSYQSITTRRSAFIQRFTPTVDSSTFSSLQTYQQSQWQVHRRNYPPE